jgi:hypothetical protein
VEDDIIPNKYIVGLADGYGDAGAEAAALVEEVRTVLRTAAGAGAAAAAAGQAADAGVVAAVADSSSTAADGAAPAESTPADGAAAAAAPATSVTVDATEDDIAVVKVIQAAATDLGVATAAAGAAPLAATIVLRASQAAIQRVRTSQRVKAVIPDRYIRPQARGLSQAKPACVTATVMRSGVSTTAAAGLATAFAALRCNVAGARYVWKGSMCRGSVSGINYTEVAAVRGNNAMLRSSTGAPCRLLRSTSATANRQRFGDCGTAAAPVLAPTLPMRVCSATGGGGGLGVGTTPTENALPKVPLQQLEQVRGWLICNLSP